MELYNEDLIKKLNLVDHIPQSTVSAYNRSKSWQYGYLENYDIINISKNGTIGSLVEVGGLKIALPKKPAKEKIMFSDLPKSEQYWRPQKLPTPSRVEWSTSARRNLWQTMHSEVIDREWERRTDGVWIMRNGEATYLTGGNYFYIQHNHLDVGLAKYRESGRAWFYFWEACIADPRCFGLLFGKSRRIGASFMGGSELLNHGTRTKAALFGAISKTNTDAKSLFTRKIIPSWKKMWPPFRPAFERTQHKKDLVLVDSGSPSDEGLLDLEGTTIDFRSTTLDAYDSEKLTILLGDEIGKFPPEVYIVDYWGKVSPTFNVGSTIVGKACFVSTCNAYNNGGKGFKELWRGSDPLGKRDPVSGWTETGLYRYFISSYDNYEGCFDLYGNCIRHTPPQPIKGQDGKMITRGSIELIQARIARRDTAEKRINERREYATCVEDMFLEPAGHNILSVEKLNEQLEYNHANMRNPVRYSMRWKDNIKDSEVVLVPDPSGQFYMANILPPHMRNKFRDDDGFAPINYRFGAGGCDSFDHNDVNDDREGRFSNGAFHFKTKSTIAEPLVPHNTFFLEYIHRPPTAKMFYEDLLMACAYTGMPVLIEDAKPGIISYFQERGYGRFLLPRPLHLIPENQRKNAKLIMKPGLPATREIVMEHGSEVADWVLHNMGVTQKDELGNPDAYGNFIFNRTIQQCLEFDINNRKKSDAVVSMGLALLATVTRYVHLSDVSDENNSSAVHLDLSLNPVTVRN